jgi:hypothetical protein
MREALKEFANRDPTLHPRERETDASMCTTGKSKMLVGATVQLQHVGIFELCRVSIGSANAQMQVRASRDLGAMQRHVLSCETIAKLVGTFHAQDLINSRCDKLRFSKQSRTRRTIVIK